jgi:hypothetical protein
VQLHKQDPIASLAGLLNGPRQYQHVGRPVAFVKQQFGRQFLRQQTERIKSSLGGSSGIGLALGLKMCESQLSVPDLKDI